MSFFNWGYISFFKGWGCIQEWGCIQADTVWVDILVKNPNIFNKCLNTVLLTFKGTQAAQLFAEHASVTSFVAATVNQTPLFATIESLTTAWAKFLLLFGLKVLMNLFLTGFLPPKYYISTFVQF